MQYIKFFFLFCVSGECHISHIDGPSLMSKFDALNYF